ncbi:Probable endonuclease 4 [uncultured Clostridium sp.]|nr:Probable endonuclease 4 [uncultured Clostridium sp.]
MAHAIFGPAGSPGNFYALGNKRSSQMPEYLREYGLDTFEYSGGHGLRMSEKTAREIGSQAQKAGIPISVHAPYFINLANEDSEKILNSHRYILGAMQVAFWMGARRVIFHPGSASGSRSRQEITAYACSELKKIIQQADAAGFGEIILCPETMGKINQLGDLEEVLSLCSVNERLIPCIDFGHLNARTQGSLRTQADFKAVLDRIENDLGKERLDRLHMHFSHIEYTEMGEKRHLTFEDKVFGPEHQGLIAEIVRRKMYPTVICESAGTQDQDALEMKKAYWSLH